MADRETTELKTVNGHSVVYYAKIKGREFLDIVKKEYTGNEQAQGVDKALDMMQAVVVSVDGSNENMVERIKDFELEDYLEVTKTVAGLVGNFPTAK